MLLYIFWHCLLFIFLQIPLNFFDTGSSSTSTLVSCSDQRCGLGVQSADSICSTQNNQCTYTFQYGDGSGTSGFYVSDLLHFDMILGGSMIQNSSAPIVFGYSQTLQSVEITCFLLFGNLFVLLALEFGSRCLIRELWYRCSTLQTGDLTKSDRAVDGIFGFGQQGMSVISQLSSQGVAPKVFSHCLKGNDEGGGILVLGEIVEPNIVYSPLVPGQ